MYLLDIDIKGYTKLDYKNDLTKKKLTSCKNFLVNNVTFYDGSQSGKFQGDGGP